MDSSASYWTTGLWMRLEQALRAAGKDPVAVTIADFQAMEHFHTGGGQATDELLARATDFKPRRVLDIGGAIGGPARYLASKTGAHVFVAELSREFCAVGLRLTELADLTGLVFFAQADGTSLPFAGQSFDLVWMQQAGMNIRDKRALFVEIVRTLAPGGRYFFQEIAAGRNPGALSLPAPWAVRQADNHLEPPEVMRTRLRSLGLAELFFEDVTGELASFTRTRLDAMQSNGVPIMGVHLLSTGEALETTLNTLRNIEAGRIAFIRGGYRQAA